MSRTDDWIARVNLLEECIKNLEAKPKLLKWEKELLAKHKAKLAALLEKGSP